MNILILVQFGGYSSQNAIAPRMEPRHYKKGAEHTRPPLKLDRQCCWSALAPFQQASPLPAAKVAS